MDNLHLPETGGRWRWVTLALVVAAAAAAAIVGALASVDIRVG